MIVHLLSPILFYQRTLSRLSSPVPHLMSPISYLLNGLPSIVSCLLSHLPCLMTHVSHAISDGDLIYNDLGDLTILWSKLADLGNLAILTLLADLAD